MSRKLIKFDDVETTTKLKAHAAAIDRTIFKRNRYLEKNNLVGFLGDRNLLVVTGVIVRGNQCPPGWTPASTTSGRPDCVACIPGTAAKLAGIKKLSLPLLKLPNVKPFVLENDSLVFSMGTADGKLVASPKAIKNVRESKNKP